MIKAKLVKRATADGMIVIKEEIPLGKEYLVEEPEYDTLTLWNIHYKQKHTKRVIMIENQWFPTELLEIEEAKEDLETVNP